MFIENNSKTDRYKYRHSNKVKIQLIHKKLGQFLITKFSFFYLTFYQFIAFNSASNIKIVQIYLYLL